MDSNKWMELFVFNAAFALEIIINTSFIIGNWTWMVSPDVFMTGNTWWRK